MGLLEKQQKNENQFIKKNTVKNCNLKKSLICCPTGLVGSLRLVPNVRRHEIYYRDLKKRKEKNLDYNKIVR